MRVIFPVKRKSTTHWDRLPYIPCGLLVSELLRIPFLYQAVCWDEIWIQSQLFCCGGSHKSSPGEDFFHQQYFIGSKSRFLLWEQDLLCAVLHKESFGHHPRQIARLLLRDDDVALLRPAELGQAMSRRGGKTGLRLGEGFLQLWAP